MCNPSNTPKYLSKIPLHTCVLIISQMYNTNVTHNTVFGSLIHSQIPMVTSSTWVTLRSCSKVSTLSLMTSLRSYGRSHSIPNCLADSSWQGSLWDLITHKFLTQIECSWTLNTSTRREDSKSHICSLSLSLSLSLYTVQRLSFQHVARPCQQTRITLHSGTHQ